MLDIKFIRENRDLVKEAIDKKGVDLDLEELLKVDEERRQLISRHDDAKAKQNQASDRIAQASGDEKQAMIADMKGVAQEVQDTKDTLQAVEARFHELMLLVPQIPTDRAPVGNESANKVVKTVGEPPSFNFEIKDHIELGKTLDIIDLERGVKLMGTRGYILKNEGAQLEQALVAYALEFLRERDFTQVNTPVFAQARFFEGTGHFPFAQQETFKVLDQNDEGRLFLIGTSEVPLCGLHADEILPLAGMPTKYCAATNCFRTEVGSYGKDTHGLYRVKQFVKVEQVVMMQADYEASTQMLQELLANAEAFVQSLELPYRVLQIATGDMGAGKYEMFDIETWMPSREYYGETHSASNLGDWQARRLNIRYEEGGKKIHCHTLNNTLMASPRLLIPLLENHQQEDGSVLIPQALRPYMNGLTHIRPKS